MRAFIAITLYCQRDKHIDHMFLRAFVEKRLVVGIFNSATYGQMVLDTKVVRTSLAMVPSLPTSFTLQTFLDSPMSREHYIAKIRLLLVRSYISEMRIGIRFSGVQTDWSICTRQANPGHMQNTLEPYLLCSSNTGCTRRLEVVSMDTPSVLVHQITLHRLCG